LPPWEQHIRERHQELAPLGWTLALASEVPGRQAEEIVDSLYEELIAWYPGFKFRQDAGAEADDS
jgi:hypothetical protein